MSGVETRSKKKPLSPSPHKTGMVEKQTPSSSDKRKLERADKKGSPSPLRRSGRIEKNGFSSSPSSKKSSNSSSSQGNKNKEENIEKLKAADTDEQSNNNEADTKSGGSSNKRKRLDFRSYRSFLMPQVKRAKCSGGEVSARGAEGRVEGDKDKELAARMRHILLAPLAPEASQSILHGCWGLRLQLASHN